MDISVYMPVYNGAKTIRRCIDSVLSQEFNGEWEFIIVDDGSEDETVMLIKDYDDPRIKLFERPHLQIVEASNFALEQCTGKYCARIDSDDVMAPNRLQIQFDFMEANPEFGLTCGVTNRISNGHTSFIKLEGKEIKKSDLFLYYPVTHSSVMFRRDLGLKYDKEYEWAEDLNLYFEFLENGGRIYRLPETLCDCYMSATQISSLLRNESNKQMFKVRMKYLTSGSKTFPFFKKQEK